jgi:hypothetical protein
MLATEQGLTKMYNALKCTDSDDSRVLELRRLHEEMDRVVLDAYGWTDIEVPPYCPKNDAERAAVKAFEDEVIDRLFALNAERAAQERAATSSVATTTTRAKTKQGARTALEAPTRGAKLKSPKKTTEGQGSLF